MWTLIRILFIGKTKKGFVKMSGSKISFELISRVRNSQVASLSQSRRDSTPSPIFRCCFQFTLQVPLNPISEIRQSKIPFFICSINIHIDIYLCYKLSIYPPPHVLLVLLLKRACVLLIMPHPSF